ncbi:MAG: hypothetical protein K2Y05_01340 [Hyphomicrobiaceae bacterium]|nr:hypothetical protein [Hyphomicrobiaceae bacterium]
MQIASQVATIARSALEPVNRRGRLLLIVVLSTAIVHILATFAAPAMSSRSPYEVLRRTAPAHSFTLLPPVTSKSQPLPFLGPDFRYAVCPFDTSRGTIAVTAKLAGQGWSISLYSPEGDNVYTAMGQDGSQADIALKLVPTGDRFLGLSPEAQGRITETQTALTLPARRGLAVLRAPDRGIAFANETEAILRRASCVLTPF